MINHKKRLYIRSQLLTIWSQIHIQQRKTSLSDITIVTYYVCKAKQVTMQILKY
uniref:Uncharacterized protein n=1 Tax=Arundo donax TaxID=35708 RepID=A0A0A9HJV6_ARUDO